MKNETIPAKAVRHSSGDSDQSMEVDPSNGNAEHPRSGQIGVAYQSSQPCTVGTILSERYEILKTLGEGGMGQVFQAYDRNTKKFCAIKVMHAHLAGSDTDLRRFEREASVSISLKHQRIVDVFDLGFTNQQKPFFVMELIQGRSLADILYDQETLIPREFLNIFSQICDGISFAHANNVVHRDIKPSNIMIVERDGMQQVKIVDFGIARICKTTGEICPTTLKSIMSQFDASSPLAMNDERLQHLTQPGEIFGSPLYMSPEQCRGETADCRSEVFALGCMMFEALTGTAPLKGGSAMQTVVLRLTGVAPSINEAVPGLTFPLELDAIVARALERDPEDRYETVEQLLMALRHLAHTLASTQSANTSVNPHC